MQKLHFAFPNRRCNACLDTAVGVFKATFPSLEINIVDFHSASDLEVRGDLTRDRFKQICTVCREHDGYVYSFPVELQKK